MMEIQEQFSLKAYNTFAVDVLADFFVEVYTEQDIFDLISLDVFATHPHLILGAGANILFTKNYPGLVIKIDLLGKEIVQEDTDNVWVKVGAGEDRHEFIMRSLEHGYVGGENMVLIPGQVGSAPVGNIGAYGKETKDIVYEVEGIDIVTKEKKVRTNAECQFGYRESIFKHALQDKIIITAVTFVFTKESPEYIPNIQYADIQHRIVAQGLDPLSITAQEVADSIITIRESKLPDRRKIGTAGSFFKNPIITQKEYDLLLQKYPEIKGNAVSDKIKLSAGQLIELAGYKGKQVGAVATYVKHALIIVNMGGASGAEVRAFAQSIQAKVKEMFDVTLEPEVIIM
ncbi:MAG TPA: UDP-N-acetylmuramate dehydrogenase [Candidatus Absconditabacterales bacterium]|nr:UDP-N-acetylmuramate dehydrogenase [Candidatus Absconditabacterales bacterium]